MHNPSPCGTTNRIEKKCNNSLWHCTYSSPCKIERGTIYFWLLHRSMSRTEYTSQKICVRLTGCLVHWWRCEILPPSLNIFYFDFFTPTLTIHLILKKIKVMKKIKYILKLYYIINHIIVKICNKYKFYFQ
jgi:hypothetical protein